MEGFVEPPHDAGTTPHREKGQNMAERQETRQEQETRWNAQRTARNEAQAGYRARRKKNKRLWLTVAVIIVPIAVIAAVVLL
jgi:hypothetical protein